MQSNMLTTKIKSCLSILLVIFVCTVVHFAQKTVENKLIKPNTTNILSQTVRSTPAYAEMLLRKTERESELEEFLLDYTEEFPKVKELKYELELIQKEADKILAVSASETGKLTLALGKLMVRKIELEVDLWNLRNQYKDDHAEVKRARRKMEVYEKAIKEIFP